MALTLLALEDDSSGINTMGFNRGRDYAVHIADARGALYATAACWWAIAELLRKLLL